MRTKYIDEQGKCDIVNRFGLETENSGTVQLNLNLCYQSAVDRKAERKKASLFREAVQLETKKQVNHYKLQMQNEIERQNEKKMQRQQLVTGVDPDVLAQEKEVKLDYATMDDRAQQFDQQKADMSTNLGKISRF